MTCGCKSGCSSGCSGGSGCCDSNKCGCVKPQTAVPMPYYEQACEVQECHTEQVIYEAYATAIKTGSTFNIPACDATATITIPGLKNIQVGAYIWNATYGYFKVESFDYLASQIVVRNECQVGNEAAGTSVPACTLFTVTDPPQDSSSGQLGVFVAVDFVAPAIGNCIPISVTSVAGLTIGENVQISSGIYRVSAINNSTTITICNDGSGVVFGTTIYAKDGSGLYITPVTPLSSNACENTPNTTGALLSCKANVQAPLQGTALGQIPVLINPATGEAQYQSLDLPTSVCTTMASCLNLLAGTDTYTIVVDNSGIFVLGDIVIIHDAITETMRWEVTGIPDASHVQITSLDPIVVSAEVGCDNAPVCLAPCCEQLQAGTQICTYDWSAAFKSEADHVDGASEAGTLESPAEGNTNTFTGTGRSVILTNETCNPMPVLVHWDYLVVGTLKISQAFTSDEAYGCDHALISFRPFTGADIVAIAAAFPAPVYTLVSNLYKSYAGANPGSADYRVSETFHFTELYTVPANSKINIYGRLDLVYEHYETTILDPLITGDMTITSCITRIHAEGVAVQAAP